VSTATQWIVPVAPFPTVQFDSGASAAGLFPASPGTQAPYASDVHQLNQLMEMVGVQHVRWLHITVDNTM
jgi:hypothetical protein